MDRGLFPAAGQTTRPDDLCDTHMGEITACSVGQAEYCAVLTRRSRSGRDALDREIENNGEMALGPALVATKVHAPRVRVGSVARPALEEAFVAALVEARVGLVCAPAGSGKSTLLATTIAGSDVAWLQIDRGDNDPVRFWLHVAAAIEPFAPGFGERLKMSTARLAVGDVLSVVEHLSALLDHTQPVVLVLDDYHEISSGVVHDGLDQLLQSLPDAVSVVISSRIDPPLPSLSLLRVRGQLAEVRASDLRFDVKDAAALLTHAISEPLEERQIQALIDRTEGWAAGLYLAALSIERHGDASAVLAAFGGNDRLVVEYLSAQFIDGLGELDRRFLLDTCVLEELNGPLCDAVRQSDDSLRHLRELERSNLLIVPLDTIGDRFRYHHLFGDMLRAELGRTAADRARELHRRAAVWCFDDGQGVGAVDHAVAAQDWALGVAAVEKFWRPTMLAGQIQTVRYWFELLGDDLIAEHPALCLALAQVEVNSAAEPATVGRWLDHARSAAVGAVDQTDLHRVTALHLRQIGDLGGAMAAVEALLELEQSGATLASGDLSVAGSVLFLSGQLDRARSVLELSLQRCEPFDLLDGQFAGGHLAAVEYQLGHRREASRLAEKILVDARLVDLEEWPTTVGAWLVLGQVALDAGDLETAGSRLETAELLARRGRYRPLRYLALVELSRFYAVRHVTAEAKRLERMAEAEFESMPDADLVQSLATGSASPTHRQRASGVPLLIEDLTDRELSVLRLLPSELTVREIGSELFVSHNTAKGHVKAIYRKLAVSSRQGAIDRARTVGLLN